jgi:hypothetical protein
LAALEIATPTALHPLITDIGMPTRKRIDSSEVSGFRENTFPEEGFRIKA